MSQYVDFGEEDDDNDIDTSDILGFEESSSFIDGTFLLWDTKINAFEIFNILRGYLDENGLLDTTLLLRLIDSRKLELEPILMDIPYIHSGYLEERERLRKANGG